MKLNKFSTALTIAVFAVVGLSGLAMFLGIKNAPLHLMHEYIGVAMIAVVALHLVNHAKSTIAHFGKPVTHVALAAMIAVGAAFFIFVPSNGVNGAKEISSRAQRAPVSDLAPLFNVTSDEFVAKLSAKGYAANANQSLSEIAKANNTNANFLITAILSKE
ncbi:MAG: hypothetical protein LBU73_00715 [Helicobacteraceae bacterium]|jgi:hypothetical protein|nr:hypothetical protein [Helicobacteraceae bacterium]